MRDMNFESFESEQIHHARRRVKRSRRTTLFDRHQTFEHTAQHFRIDTANGRTIAVITRVDGRKPELLEQAVEQFDDDMRRNIQLFVTSLENRSFEQSTVQVGKVPQL